VNSTGVCGECLAAEHMNHLPGAVVAIGDDVSIRVAVGRGHDTTVHSFHQCENCGSIWVQYSDSGAGGHGRFIRRLTAGLF
jgi:hypothetical protein